MRRQKIQRRDLDFAARPAMILTSTIDRWQGTRIRQRGPRKGPTLRSCNPNSTISSAHGAHGCTAARRVRRRNDATTHRVDTSYDVRRRPWMTLPRPHRLLQPRQSQQLAAHTSQRARGDSMQRETDKPTKKQRSCRRPLPALLRREDAAEFLGLSPSALDRACAAGLVPKPFRLGGVVVYRRRELAAWVRAGMPPADRWEEEIASRVPRGDFEFTRARSRE